MLDREQSEGTSQREQHAEGRIGDAWSVFGDAYVQKQWDQPTDYGAIGGIRYRW